MVTEDKQMRIMDLDFQSALKYAWLGDHIWRAELGRKRKFTIVNYQGERIDDATVGLRWPNGVPASLDGLDVIATDWVAELATESV